MTPQRCTHRRADSLALSYLDSHPRATDRAVVVLLHGFPDNAQMWAPQFAALVDAGFRVIAPDLRGYGASDMAPRQRHYRIPSVLADLTDLLDALHIDRVHLAGHDWGAALAWAMAADHPGRIDRLAVLSVGHPTAYARAGIRQKLRGWYIFLFLATGLAERLLPARNWGLLRAAFGSHPRLDVAIADLRRPGRLTAALRLYRANFWTILTRRFPPVGADTLGVIGDRDAFLVPDQMRRSGAYVNGRWRFELLAAGHWVGLEQADAINALLIEHFTSN